MDKNPKVSIITVCYNAGKFIEDAIRSVLVQTYPAIEYIVVDGASTDNTLSIINKYKTQITKIISEKDSGLYDAMNKGAKLSSGDIIYFLNADDRLCDSRVIEAIVHEFLLSPDAEIVYGKIKPTHLPLELQFSFDSVFTGHMPFKTKKDLLRIQPCHQCIFAKRTVFDKIGLFNIEYKIAADIDWFCRMLDHKIVIKFTDIFAVFLYFQGLSYQQNPLAFREKDIIFSKNFTLLEYLYARWHRGSRTIINMTKFYLRLIKALAKSKD